MIQQTWQTDTQVKTNQPNIQTDTQVKMNQPNIQTDIFNTVVKNMKKWSADMLKIVIENMHNMQMEMLLENKENLPKWQINMLENNIKTVYIWQKETLIKKTMLAQEKQQELCKKKECADDGFLKNITGEEIVTDWILNVIFDQKKESIIYKYDNIKK